MKRKIFSKLLMVALVIAAVGSFVSCKDYDDDINNLQKQIDNAALKSSVESLEKTLNDKIAAAQSAAQAAQTAADKAATTANAAVTKTQLDDAISAAKAAAATAANEYADKVATAAQTAAAKEAYEKAEKYVNDEVAKVTAAIPSEAAIKAVADASAAALDEALATELKAWVNEQIDAIDVKGQVDAAVADAVSKIDTAAANVAAIWSAVTSIEFFIGENNVWVNTDILNFQYGKEKANVFGNATEPHAYKAADEYKTYTAGDSIKAENVYLVRVSPVTADLTTANLKLINSKGENLDEFVTIKAEKYNDILTRAGETGLWKLTVTLKDEDVKIEDLQKAVHAIVKGNVQTSAAVYAFAANNTGAASADRYAVTAYDLLPLTNKYAPTSTLNFNVNGIAVGNIHNRWQGGFVQAEDETKNRDEANFELKWNAAAVAKGLSIPDTKIIKKGGSDSNTDNAIKDDTDVRLTKACLGAKVNEPIVISFNAADFTYVDRYYVLYDKDNAIESNPSEWNAWKEYEISGLGEMKKATERLVITVTDSKAEGDILGFRLYAVNYDGTLVDPDGKAFYVQIGENTDLAPVVVEATYNVNKASASYAYDVNDAVKNGTNSVVFAYSLKDLGYADAIKLDDAGFGKTFKASQVNNKTAARKDINVRIEYLTSGEVDAYGDAQVTDKINKVTHIVATILNPEDVIDGATIVTDAVSLVNPDDHKKKIATLSFSLKKGTIKGQTNWGANIPTWKTGYGTGNSVTLYPGVDDGTVWNVAFAAGKTFDMDLSKYINNLTDAVPDKTVITVNGANLVDDLGGAIADYYAVGTGVFTIPADEVGPKAYRNTTYNTYTLALYGNDTENLSLKWAKNSDQKDAAAPGQVVANPHESQVFSTTLKFDNIWNYETYAVNYVYVDGKVGDETTKFTNKFSDKVWVSYTAIADATTPFDLGQVWVDALDDADPTTPKWIAVAKADYDWTTNNWVVGASFNTVAKLLTSSENSAVTSFADGGFAPTNYVSYSNPVVISPNGKENEYIEFYDANIVAFQTDGTGLYFVRVADAPAILPTAKIEMKFQFTATDAYGVDHKIQVPFTLVR